MISWVAMDRIVERKRAADASYRKQARGKGAAFGCQVAHRRRVGQVVLFRHRTGPAFAGAALRPGVVGGRDRPAAARPAHLSRQSRADGKRLDLDCLSALWQRWFPDKPSFEALDNKMQAGYELRESGAVAVCRVWLEAWSDVLRILDKAGMQSIQEFDDWFGGSQSPFNWIQDLEGELWNAGLEDRQFLSARIALCEEGLRRFPLTTT